MTKISKRLFEISKEVKAGAIVYDLGCDTGILASFLSLDKASFVLGVDLSKDSINKANNRQEIKGGRAKFKVGSGLTYLDNSFDTLIISGLGGKTIINLLKDDLKNLKYFILSPQSDLEYFRKSLHEMGFKYTEKLIYDKKYYHIFSATLGHDKYTDLEYKYGKEILEEKDKKYFKFLSKLYEYKDDEIIKEVLDEGNN